VSHNISFVQISFATQSINIKKTKLAPRRLGNRKEYFSVSLALRLNNTIFCPRHHFSIILVFSMIFVTRRTLEISATPLNTAPSQVFSFYFLKHLLLSSPIYFRSSEEKLSDTGSYTHFYIFVVYY